MFVHAVYFWLRSDLSAEEHAQFRAGVQSLTTIESVQQAYVGEPAPTDRDVIERGYSVALIALFPDQAAQDHYQVHAVHDTFREECAPLWDKVVVYDTIC